jgi:DNA-binding XRE family transcriptional regulator
MRRSAETKSDASFNGTSMSTARPRTLARDLAVSWARGRLPGARLVRGMTELRKSVMIPALVILAQDNAVVKPAQVKMARAALDWSLEDLAQKAGVHRNTISNFETGKFAGDPETLRKLQRALEAAGVEFTNGDHPGVRLKRKR